MNKKVALISGGASGMGEAVAEFLCQKGINIAILDIDISSVTQPDYFCIKGDVAEEKDWEKALELIKEKWGRLDILINAAGILGKSESIDEYSVENFDRILNINLKGSFLGIKHTSNLMKASGGGNIINFASLSSYGAAPNALGYVTSKHAVVGLTKAASRDLVEYRIRVNAVAPGFIDTPLLQNIVNRNKEKFPDVDFKAQMTQNIPMKRMGTSREVAQVIAFLISEEADYITGVILPVDGGILSK
ncbi:MAG: SDR family oxidoreductase [Bacteroidetes bacterium]|nr:SDR family oxidoreductase [Bacteroidota bacterium]